ncbi:YkgJ family cysteine cluster protein [Clostridium sp. FP2]|uniref:YkgJ family cysteine cluster protein n=1 Tax=Clostridium TaxID=1485 RepID=UPI0013E91D40|nr:MULTISPECIES: YkgJ family cysteine cluster protein [Clostridium]MBW9156335.1 YkgJ family cysteine cluster protein [Clostridium tagluense]MBZ9624376.1 YkgJ family cysteine cluster protein [Clostridium sp. FP2]WLC64251.1 YkgJ family cysteine cluster protein [Clostridium tagluense]
MKFNASVSIIPKDQLCICGSGLNFSDCCMKKNHTYEAILLPDTGRQIIYDQTEIITAVQKINGFIESRIDSIISGLSPEEASRKLRRLYEKLDNALKPIEKVTSCKQGCNHCCFLPILSSQLENELIKDYMSEHYSKDMMAEFNYKIHQNKETLSRLVHTNGRFMDENYKLYANANIPCAFLDSNSNCTIYSVRPFICRKYLVFNEPTLCENTLNKTDQYYSTYLTKVKDSIIKLNELTYGENFQYKHILSWFV